MPIPICATCGAHYPPAEVPPDACVICEDERQWVPPTGQVWTTWDALRETHRVRVEEDAGILGFGVAPDFAIAQRALLVETPAGNVLWDCVPLVDDAAVEAIRARGGVVAIAVSHPHFYSGAAEWSRSLGGVPVYLHAADARWVTRPDPRIFHWESDWVEVVPGVVLHRLGGHFPGSAVLWWEAGPDGTGALLTGDTIQVLQDRRWVSFLWSYPNLVPLPARTVEGIAARVAGMAYTRLYGAWWGRTILEDGPGVVARSAARYVQALSSVRED